MNAYLKRLREQYDGIRTSIEGLQTRAVDANRDLTEDERKSVGQMGEQAKGMLAEIESLTDIETRNAKVADLDRGLERHRAEGEQTRGTRTEDRDEIYTRSARRSFFGDQFQAQMGDRDAAARLADHVALTRESEQYRAVTTTSGAGIVPPRWLLDEFANIRHRGLRVAARLRQVTLTDPTPMVIPVAGTPATVAVQVTEGVNPAGSSDPTYSSVTVVPKAITGWADVSRQMLEASNPAVDQVIWSDQIGHFNDQAELQVTAKILAQSGVNTVSIAGVAPTSLQVLDGLVDASMLVADNAGADADSAFMSGAEWGALLKARDGANRPLVVGPAYGPANAQGLAVLPGTSVPISGNVQGLDAITSPGFPGISPVASRKIAVVNADDLLFMSSTPDRFSYEQIGGPALIRVGVWGYVAVVTERRPKAITIISFTGA